MAMQYITLKSKIYNDCQFSQIRVMGLILLIKNIILVIIVFIGDWRDAEQSFILANHKIHSKCNACLQQGYSFLNTYISILRNMDNILVYLFLQFKIQGIIKP